MDLKSAFDFGALLEVELVPLVEEEATARGTNESWLRPLPLGPGAAVAPAPREGPACCAPFCLGGGRLISTDSGLPLKSLPSVARRALEAASSVSNSM